MTKEDVTLDLNVILSMPPTQSAKLSVRWASVKMKMNVLIDTQLVCAYSGDGPFVKRDFSASTNIQTKNTAPLPRREVIEEIRKARERDQTQMNTFPQPKVPELSTPIQPKLKNPQPIIFYTKECANWRKNWNFRNEKVCSLQCTST